MLVVADLQVVAMVTDGQRPEIPEASALPSPSFGGMPEYLALMAECWAQREADRPTFGNVIARLR